MHHPSLLYQLAAARTDERRHGAARASATRAARSARRRWPRWLLRTAAPRTGGRLDRDSRAIAIRSSAPPTTTSTLYPEGQPDVR
jgi:hypothetical protein